MLKAGPVTAQSTDLGLLSGVRAMMDDVPIDDAFSAPLVGREVELDAVLALVGQDRGANAALVSGDAGVGKTRLLREVVDRARAAGDMVLVGHCLHFGGDGVPYLPISEAFGRLARDEPELVERLRTLYPPIARLLPQRRLIGAPPETAAPLEWAELFEAIFGALVTLAEQRPVVLVIEDMHWADGSTRDLVGFLLARLTREQVSVVVSYRSDDLHRRHPLRPRALEWGRVSGVVKVGLAPLGDDAMRVLVRQRHHGPLPDKAVNRILDRAGGNAFFAEQLLAELDGSDRMPGDLAELLLMRLDRLSPQARDVVRAAAVAGRQISHPMIAAVADIADEALDTALREAVDAHVLDRRGSNAFAFRHALLAEAVYDDLLPGERVRLHRAFAGALVAGRVRGTDADLARHAREAMDLDTAFDATVRAGDEAMRVAAPNEAMRHYEAALALAGRLSNPVVGSAELVLRAADAASAAGHQFRAVQLVREAYDALPAGIDPRLRVELLIAIATYALPLDSAEDFFATSAEAVRLVPTDPPSALRARALAVHARAAAEVNRDDDAARWATQAHDMACELGLPEVAADAATTLGRLHDRSANPGGAVHLIESSIAQAVAAGNLGAQLRGLHSLGGLHYDGGDLPRAVTSLRAAMLRSKEGGRPWAVHGFDARVMLSQAYYVMGEWDQALALCSAEGDLPPPQAEAALTAISLAVLAGRGALDSDAQLGALRRWWRRDGMIALLAGAAYIDVFTSRDDVGTALALHDELVDVVADVWQNTWFQARIRLHSLALAALARATATATDAERRDLVERGRTLVAQTQTTVEQGLTRRPVQGPEGKAWLRRARAEWARLRWAAGVDAPQAVELVAAWRAAAEAFDYGHVYERARSQVRLAAALQATGDTPAAQAAADEARTVARALGAEPLLDELRALSLRPVRAAAGTEPQPLTPREDQVLQLLAQGRTNRQIAGTLYISDKTVSVHVSNILAKLGASGRTQAAAIARRDGLLAP